MLLKIDTDFHCLIHLKFKIRCMFANWLLTMRGDKIATKRKGGRGGGGGGKKYLGEWSHSNIHSLPVSS